MNSHVSAITLGVADLDRSRRFYCDLGWSVAQQAPYFIMFGSHDGSSPIALYPTQALAQDAGVTADGAGFRGFAFSYIVRSDARVDAILAEAENAGGRVVVPAQRAQWGGYYGYFADPDGFLWKVVAGEGDRPYAE